MTLIFLHAMTVLLEIFSISMDKITFSCWYKKIEVKRIFHEQLRQIIVHHIKEKEYEQQFTG